MKRGPAILLLLILSLLAGQGARVAVRTGYERVAHYAGAPTPRTAVAGGPVAAAPAASARPQAAPPAPPAPKAVLILVDGLRAEDAVRLPTLARLAREGASFAVAPVAPAWDAPAWGTALTGRPPADHGLLLAGAYRPPGPAGLLPAARQMNLEVAAAGSSGLLQLAGPWLSRGAHAIPSGWEGTGQALVNTSQAVLGAGAHLAVMHLEGLHAVAHRPEQPDQPQVPWDEALAWTDARLALILQRIDLTRTAVAVAGTYPAGPAGAHLPPAPVALVLAGAGVAPGGLPGAPAAAEDLAPTVGALLGLPPFTGAGRPLWGALAPDRQAARAAWAEAAARAAPPPAPDLKARLLLLWAQVQPQAAWAGGAALLLLLYLALALRQPFGRPVLLGLLAYLTLYYLLFFAMGGRFSDRLPHLEAPGAFFWRDRVIQTAGAMVPAVLLVGWLQGRRGTRRPGYAIVAALHLNLAVLALLTLQVLGLVLLTGWGDQPRWPGLGWTVKYFLDALQGMLLGFGAPVWAVAAGLTATLSRVLAGPPPVAEAPAAPRLSAGQAVGRALLPGRRPAPRRQHRR